MKDNIVKRVIILFLIMLIILVGVAITAVQNIQRSMASSDWVNHTHAEIMEADAILVALHRGDAALRSFLLTGDERDLRACREAYSEMLEHLEIGKALSRQEPAQNQKFTQLEQLLTKRLDFTRDAVKTRQQGGQEAIRKIVVADAGSETIQDIRRAVKKLKDEEQELLQARDKTSFLHAQSTRWTVLTGLMLNFILLAFVAWLVRDDIVARRKAATALQEANEQLERKVQERTAELAQANKSLKTENLERQWANQSLEHQLRYSQLIINSINDLIFVVTKAMNITRINPAVIHVTGLESKELVSGPISRVVRLVQETPAKEPNHDPMNQALKDGRDLQDWPAVVVSKYNQNIPCRFNLFPLRDQDKVVGGVVTLRRV